MGKWRKEDENIKSYIKKMNVGKKIRIWQPAKITFGKKGIGPKS